MLYEVITLLVGVIYDRAHTRGLNEFGGVYNKMPIYSFLTVIAFFAAIGLPSMSGFISEAFVFLGAFQTNKLWTILSTLGIVLGAGYMLWTFQRVFIRITSYNVCYTKLLRSSGSLTSRKGISAPSRTIRGCAIPCSRRTNSGSAKRAS